MAKPQSTNPAPQKLPAHASLSTDDLRLQLKCPKCNRPSWVAWRQLPHLLTCPGCSNSIWISKSGHIESQHECGTIQIPCPRCQEKHAWPADAPLKQIRCRGCRYNILPAEVEALGLSHPLSAISARNAQTRENWESKPLSRRATVSIALAICGAIVLVAGTLVRLMSPDRELIDSASRFTIASALDDADKAAFYLPSDQAAAHKRWRAIHFSTYSISASDRLEVSIQQYVADAATVCATLGHGPRDRLVLIEHWKRSADGAWQFDANSSLTGATMPTSP